MREELLDLLARLRADERLLIPLGEPNLDASVPWKRRVKFTVFRSLRFLTRRYDRLIGDVTELAAALAQRLATAEQEIAALRERLETADRDPPSEGPTEP